MFERCLKELCHSLMVALGRLCFSCFTGASGAVASVPFMPCFHLAYVVGPGITLPFPAFIRWKVEVCGSAGEVGGVSAVDDAGDIGAVGGASDVIGLDWSWIRSSLQSSPEGKARGLLVLQ